VSRRPGIAADGRGWRIAGVAALATGQAAAAGVAAFSTRDVFAALHAAGPTPAAALAAIALSGLVTAALRVAERALAERVGCDYAAALRERLFLHGARTPPSAIASRSRGGLALRFVGDLSAVRGWVAQGVARLVSAAVTLPASLTVLFLLDPRLGAAATPPLLLSLATLAALDRPLAEAHRRLRRRRARIAGAMTESLSHGAALRLVGRVAAERRRLARDSRRLADLATARTRLAAAARAIFDAAAGCAAAAVLATAFATDVAPATAAGALAALGLALQPMRRLAEVHDRRQAWRVARAQIDRALGQPALPRRSACRRRPKPDAPALVMRNGQSCGLRVAGGEIVTIRAADHAAASVLLKRAAGLEPTEACAVLAFGREPATLPRRMVGYVGPASPILRGALRRNLTLGVGGTEWEVADAVARAGLGPLATRIGLEGRLAEDGRDLSVDERARLLIGRALLERPRLLLLDACGLAIPEELTAMLAADARERDAAVLIAAPAAWRAAFADRTVALSDQSLGRTMTAQGNPTVLLRSLAQRAKPLTGRPDDATSRVGDREGSGGSCGPE